MKHSHILGLVVLALFLAVASALALGVTHPTLYAIATVADIVILVALLAVLLCLMAVFGWLLRHMINSLDDRIMPKVVLNQKQWLILGLGFSFPASVLQMALASFLIPFSPLRPLFDSIGAVDPVLHQANLMWGLWGMISFFIGYFYWHRKPGSVANSGE